MKCHKGILYKWHFVLSTYKQSPWMIPFTAATWIFSCCPQRQVNKGLLLNLLSPRPFDLYTKQHKRYKLSLFVEFFTTIESCLRVTVQNNNTLYYKLQQLQTVTNYILSETVRQRTSCIHFLQLTWQLSNRQRTNSLYNPNSELMIANWWDQLSGTCLEFPYFSSCIFLGTFSVFPLR